MCGAVHCSDIAILGIHRKPPKVNEATIGNQCEIPTTIASCPTGAIAPNPAAKSVKIKEERCMYCGNCYTMCPSLPLADAHGDGISIYVGGKVSNARGPARMSKLAIPFLPNNPPRWPEVVKAVKHLVEVYAKDAHQARAFWRVDRAHRLGAVLQDDRYTVHLSAYRRFHLCTRYVQNDPDLQVGIVVYCHAGPGVRPGPVFMMT